MGNKGGKIVLTDDIVSQISISSGIDPSGVRTQCENFLKEYPKGCMDKKAFRKFIKEPWLEVFPKLSVPTLHNIRATKATHLYKIYRSELIVQRYLGHEDIRTT